MSWAVKLRVNPEQVQIKSLADKWGSCAPDGIVTLADDLATECEDFQNYVIVHELLHLRYRDHGKQFKAMMTALVPNWRAFAQKSQQGTERQTGTADTP